MTADPWSDAEPYERFMGRWSRLLAAQVLEWVDPPPRLRWLDVGCGTGAASAAVLAVADPSSLVCVDPSEAFVAAATVRLADPRVTVKVGDALALPVADASVDAVITGLVLNFVPDQVRAASEIRRVLVAGGQVSAYVWDYAEGMELLRLFWEAALVEDPGAAVVDESSRFPICRPGGLERCFDEAGFDVVRAAGVGIPTIFSDFDDFWQPFLGGQGTAPAYCATLDEETLARIGARLLTSLPREGDGTIRLTARAWAINAVPRVTPAVLRPASSGPGDR